MVIRRITGKDVRKAARIYRYELLKKGMSIKLNEAEDYFINGIKSSFKDEAFFVVDDGDKIAGFLNVIIDNFSVAQVKDFFILKESRGKGLGRAVVKELLEWCVGNNVRKVFGFFDIDDSILFRSMGFREEGVLIDHYRKGDNLNIMAADIEKRERQVNLQKKLEEEDVEIEASKMLRKLPLKK